MQRFQRGVITAEPGVGSFVVRGGMHGYWAGHVKQTGFPVSNEAVDVSGVGVQRFRNETLVWSAATGTHPVRGAIRGAYVAAGGPANVGAPSGPEYTVTGGAAQDFLIPATGSRYTFTWHAATGRTFMVRGGIRTGWTLSKRIGAAVSAERGGLLRGGSWQNFSAGRAYWSPQTGGHTIRGAILGAWQREGHERGLGYPVAEERSVTGGAEQRFERGIMRYSAATRTVTTVRAAPPAPEPSDTTAFDAEAARFGLGAPSGGKVSVAGTSARRYAHGTVYHSASHGYVLATANVAAVWERSPAMHGLPRAAAWTGGALSTRFEKDSLVLDGAMGKVVRSDLALGAGDALVIGDSQVADTSWVGKGIAANGYHLTAYRSGGIGYVADNQGNRYGSYGTGVLDNQWALPRGTPGMIFVGGSGNDRGSSSAVITSRSTAVIRELQRLYPTSTIVMTGVISRSDVLYAERQRVEEALRVTAETTGAHFIPLRGWIDTYNARGYMYDAYHFNEAGQVHMGAIFAPELKRALARTS
ncbi:GDSL-type esterase/lipase family protein [Kocuria tytonis]|uniref:SGNH hydrolase-type esterase domain-containing protein n=1 Tax=Kocuria tytonis TaxID=2054280 RepID=A0A495A5G1_9MICC|nr:GDSL-type esterase/lipase family protein [Kocuria tytonis]RKQ35058.1 hypothetical protein C1C97_007245 [Kocuria tytonis]